MLVCEVNAVSEAVCKRFNNLETLPTSKSDTLYNYFATDGKNNFIIEILQNDDNRNHLFTTEVTSSFTLDDVRAHLRKCKSELFEFISSNLTEYVDEKT